MFGRDWAPLALSTWLIPLALLVAGLVACRWALALWRDGDPAAPPGDGAMNHDILTLTDVRKSFGDAQIIRGVNLAVRAGRRHAVIGWRRRQVRCST